MRIVFFLSVLYIPTTFSFISSDYNISFFPPRRRLIKIKTAQFMLKICVWIGEKKIIILHRMHLLDLRKTMQKLSYYYMQPYVPVLVYTCDYVVADSIRNMPLHRYISMQKRDRYTTASNVRWSHTYKYVISRLTFAFFYLFLFLCGFTFATVFIVVREYSIIESRAWTTKIFLHLVRLSFVSFGIILKYKLMVWILRLNRLIYLARRYTNTHTHTTDSRPNHTP